MRLDLSPCACGSYARYTLFFVFAFMVGQEVVGAHGGWIVISCRWFVPSCRGVEKMTLPG
jgi:hypothetical protein